MPIEVGSAFVTVIPSFRGFQAEVQRQVREATAGIGEDAGRRIGEDTSRGIGGPLAGIGAKLATAFAAVTGGGVVAGLTKATSMAKDFDLTVRQVGASTGAAGADLEALSDLALQMGRDTVFGAGEAADAMLELAKAGMDPATIAGGALEQTLLLASAGGEGLAESATTMANALATFGLEASDAGSVAAALAGGANASTASVGSLAQALSQVGPGAQLAGMTLQETVAALAAFDKAGIKGSDAGTSLKTMLSRLVPSTDAARSAMDKLGLKFTDAAGNFVPMREIAGQLQDKLKGLSDSQKSTALTTIFGADAFRAAAVLAQEGAAGLAVFEAATNDVNAANVMAKTGTEGAAGAWENLKGSVETLGIQMGQVLLPAFERSATTLTTSVIPVISSGVDALDGAINALSRGAAGQTSSAGIVGAFEDVGAAAARLPEKVSGIGDKLAAPFKGTGDKIKTAIGDIDTTSLFSKMKDGAAEGAAGVVNGLLDKLRTIDYGPLGEALGNGVATAVGAAAGVSAKLFAAIGKFIQEIDWGGLAMLIGQKVPEMLVGFVVGILNFDLGGLLGFLGENWLSVIIGLLTVAFAPAKLIGVITGVLGKIPLAGKLLVWMVNALRSFATGAVSKVGSALKTIGEGFLRGFSTIFPRIGAFLSREIPLIGTRLGVLWIQVKEKIGGFFGAIPGQVGGMLSRAGGAIGSALGKLAGLLLKGVGLMFTRVIPAVARGALSIITRLAGAIAGGVGRVVGAIGRVAAGLLRGAASGLARVVSAVVRGGASIIGRLVGAITGGIGRVVGSIGSLIARLVSTGAQRLTSAASTLFTRAGQIITRIVSALTGGLSRVGSAVGSIGTRIVSAAAGFGALLISAGGDLVRGFISGIGDMAGQAVQAAKDMASSAVNAAKSLLGIRSPSRVFLEIGRYVVAGFVKGVAGGSKDAKATTTKLITSILAASDRAMKKAKTKAQKASVRYTRDTALAYVRDTYKSKLGPQAAKLDDLTARLAVAKKAVAALRTAKDELGKAVTSKLNEGRDLFGSALEGVLPTPAAIATRLAQNLGAIKRFQATLAKLRAKGLSAEAIAQVAAQGVGGQRMADVLAASTPAQVKAINSSMTAITKEANAYGPQIAGSLYDAGIRAGDGMVKGLTDRQGAVVKAIAKIAKAMVDTLRNRLKIKSPSRVMAANGEHTIDGMVLGMARRERDVKRQAVRIADVAALAAPDLASAGRYRSAGLSHRATIGDPAAAPQVRVFIGDRELTDIVRVELDGASNTAARTLSLGRRAQ